jgi:hypothetical protein
MNERIKELALKAGGGLSCIAEPLEHPWKFSERELEKFAELIVQKCADIGQRYADGNYEVPNQILEYFGMEEE